MSREEECSYKPMEICPKTKSTSRNSVDLLRIFILFRRSTDPLSSSLSLIVVFLFLFLVIDERREGKRYFWLPEPRGRYRLADRTPAPERNDDLRSLLMLLFARTLPESLHGFGCQRSGEEKLKYMTSYRRHYSVWLLPSDRQWRSEGERPNLPVRRRQRRMFHPT